MSKINNCTMRMKNLIKNYAFFLIFIFRQYGNAKIVFIAPLFLLFFEYAAFSLMVLISNNGAKDNVNSNFLMNYWGHVADLFSISGDLVWIWLFLVLLSIRLGLGFAHQLLSIYLAKQVHKDFAAMIFNRVIEFEPLEKIYKKSIGHYIALAGEDTFRAGTIVNSTSQILVGISSTLIALYITWIFSKDIFYAVAIYFLIISSAVIFGFRGIQKSNQKSVTLSRDAGSIFIESMNSLRSIRSMHSENFIETQFSIKLREYVRALFVNEAIKNSIKYLPAMLALMLGAIVLFPGNSLDEKLTPIFIFSAITILIRLFSSLGIMVNYMALLVGDLRAAKDIGEFIGVHYSVKNSAPKNIYRANKAYDAVLLRDITYGYNEKKYILNQFNYKFVRGHSYAILGESGSGKSTLADILMGLLNVSYGNIIIEAPDIELRIGDLKVILVEQQVRIFAGSIGDNVRFGLDSTDERVMEALNTAGLGKYINNLDEGLNTQLDYMGSNISGGQRQRIGIARALIRNPDILILDEVTSALDKITAVDVMTRVIHGMRDKVIIVITHDLEVANLMDINLKM
jgi:ATP-binding cassette subfamily B protein